MYLLQRVEYVPRSEAFCFVRGRGANLDLFILFTRAADKVCCHVRKQVASSWVFSLELDELMNG